VKSLSNTRVVQWWPFAAAEWTIQNNDCSHRRNFPRAAVWAGWAIRFCKEAASQARKSKALMQQQLMLTGQMPSGDML
jgi:hypothetical protein